MKNLLKIICVFGLLSACTISEPKVSSYICPRVELKSDATKIVQLLGYSEEIKIEIIGYDGYCAEAHDIDRRFARIKPLFRVNRLSTGIDTRFDFSYTVRTIKGPPEFLGWKSYFETVNMPLDATQKDFYGKEITVRLPNEGYDEFTILLEMNNPVNEEQFPQIQIIEQSQPQSKPQSGCNSCGF